MKKILMILLCAGIAIGCASVGRKLDPNKVAKIKIGMSKEEVVMLIGTPEQITSSPLIGETYIYLYSRATPKGSSFIPVVGAFAGGANVQTQNLFVYFSTNNVVTNFVNGMSSNDVSTGANTASRANTITLDADKRDK